jgi:hypothetical protein
MRDTAFILIGIAVLALLGMGVAYADSRHELAARIVMLKDRLIYLQMQKCSQHAQSSDCTREASMLIQSLDQLGIDNAQMGWGPYGPEDPGVRFYLDKRFGDIMEEHEQLRRKYASP